MSLTAHLANGPLARWCREHLPGTPELVGELVAAVGGLDPIRPRGHVGPDHWAAVGGTFGQRLAFLIQHAPPYYPLLGAVDAQLLDDTAMHHAAAAFPSHHALVPTDRARAGWLRPARTGWLDVADAYTLPANWDVDPDTQRPVVDFLHRLATYLTQHAPPGVIGAPGVEAGLARCCWVLTGWENAYRIGHLTRDDTDLYHGLVPVTVDRMRGSAPDAAVAELVDLGRHLAATGALEQLRALAAGPAMGEPWGIAAPTLVEGWADADLLVGDTLLDVKTVMHLRDPAKVARWLWQLLGYAWLDVDDRYRIRRVGILLGRHARLVTWDLDQYAATLAGPVDIAELRRTFRTLIDRAYAADHAAVTQTG